MKFVCEWRVPPESYKAAIERFLKTGAPDPTGLKTLARWHGPGSAYGWHVVEGDAKAVAQLTTMWLDVLEIKVTPVIDDADAASSLKAVHGEAR